MVKDERQSDKGEGGCRAGRAGGIRKGRKEEAVVKDEEEKKLEKAVVEEEEDEDVLRKKSRKAIKKKGMSTINGDYPRVGKSH